MQKHLLYINLFAITSAFALTACADEVENSVTPDMPEVGEKTPIELSVGGVDAPSSALTRAVVTDGTGKTLDVFDVNTKIFMVMKSEYGPDDFGGIHDAKYNIARGDVDISKNDGTNKRSIVDFNDKNKRYWDDAHARSSMLSIWAYAQKGQTWTKCTFNGAEKDTEDESQPFAWTTTEIVPTILTWRATHQSTEAQNGQSVMAQDLLFSNNLANYDTNPSTDATKDKRLKFNFSNRKFPQVGEANMIFYHAMSKITIKIIEGDGFDKTSAKKAEDFKFTTTGGNIILKQFNHTGKFDIKEGEFTGIATSGTTDIPSIYLKTADTNATGTNPHYILEALAVPSIANNGASRFVEGKKTLATDVMMEFAIDNNKYQITSGQLFDALSTFNDEGVWTGVVSNAIAKTDNGTYIPLEAGKNYVFTFTVGKTKIKNITAQVAAWENVEAENITPSNARIKLQLEERGTSPYGEAVPSTDIYSLYRSAAKYPENTEINDNFVAYDWETRYSGNVITPTYEAATATVPAHWTTTWFWESNKHFYHFRALMPSTTGITEDATNGDYATLTSAVSYTDVRWGAPMLDDASDEVPSSTMKWNYGPTLHGFDGLDTKDANSHQIYKAIGPTEDPVKLILFHMMSDLTFNITTTTGTEAVNLGDGSTSKTKVELVNFITKGKLLLGNGLVTATGDPTNVEIAQNLFTSAVAEPASAAKVKYTYGAVPQDLATVKLRITTPDNNQYIVDLKDVKAKSVSFINLQNPYTATENKINRWYPGFKYEYSFTLKKTGITNLEATILEWEKVEAENEDVQIK